jgi:hypothetical protein
MSVDPRLQRRGVPDNPILKIEEFSLWRVVMYDRINGIVVVDVNADNEAEAKGKATSAATNHLDCKKLESECSAMRWSEMPDAWKRYDAVRH